MAEDPITIVTDDAHHRYNAVVGDKPAGVSHYRIHEGTKIFYHTEVDPAFEGQGVGSALARGVLDDIRSRGERIVAECPFIAAYIKRHPEYADLLA